MVHAGSVFSQKVCKRVYLIFIAFKRSKHFYIHSAHEKVVLFIVEFPFCAVILDFFQPAFSIGVCGIRIGKRVLVYSEKSSEDSRPFLRRNYYGYLANLDPY
jgi:hypothetical protein